MRIIWFWIILSFVAVGASAQTDTDAAESEVLPAAAGSLLVPQFPPENNALVQFEAEDAVSTNFAKEATLNYGASGFRTLQLNRYTELYGGASFYAEYVFYVGEPGTYELWYGGTPPGPEDDVFPSYASPFSLSVDGGEKRAMYREQVNVVERYSPNYYWVRTMAYDLEAGVHRLRFEVDQKRKYDGKFFFYLDSFFLINPDSFDRDSPDPVPSVFPADLNNREIDTPFKTVNDYRYLVTVEPDNPEIYINFSLIYALVGDYQNALRNVNKAMLLDPSGSEARLLAAKYRLWKGEADESLKIYTSLLELQPDLLEAWTEAGKVAAWIGKYKESIEFYDRALEYYPENINLLVNKALTYLWASREDEAEGVFEEVKEMSATSEELSLELGEILIASGYPDRAVEHYKASLEQFPDHLSFYLSLENAYAEAGAAELSTTVHEQISQRFTPSERLAALLEAFEIERTMGEQVIQGYIDALDDDPDNLTLREQLVQTYFWNGLRKKAIAEYHNILVTYAYTKVADLDRRIADLFYLVDELSVYSSWYSRAASALPEIEPALTEAVKAYTVAKSEFEKFDLKVQKAKEAGESAPQPEGTHSSVLLSEAESGLALTLETSRNRVTHLRDAIARSNIALERREQIVLKEQSEREGFARLTSSTGWRWNQAQTVDELRMVSVNGYLLADYVLGRIYSLQGLYGAAWPLLSGAEPAGGPPAEYAILQNFLWSDGFDDFERNISADPPVQHAPYLQALAELSSALDTVTQPAALFTENTLAEVQQALASAEEMESVLENHRAEVQGGLNLLHGIARSKLERAMYEYQQETYLIRFELGDYYLLEGNYDAAVEQLGYVLEVDPLNTSAIFNLGVLNQRLGRWQRAMDDYLQVYEADPRFENVSANYNLLARQHSDTAEFNHQLAIDSARFTQRSALSLENNVNSGVGFRADLISESVRMYQQFGGQTPWSIQRYDLSIGVPISFPGIGLTLAPEVGMLMASNLAGVGVTDQQIAVNPAAVIGTYFVEPVIKGSVSLSSAPLSLAGLYRYGRTIESLQPDTSRLVAHEVAADLDVGLSVLQWEDFRFSSVGVGGYFKYLVGETGVANYLFGATQDLSLVFNVSEAPWTNFTITEQIAYSDSALPGASEYYAPDSVIQISGTAGVGTWINFGREANLGIIANAGGGVVFNGAATDSPLVNQLLNADARVEITFGDITYYLALQAAGSFQGIPNTVYWSATGSAGARARLPRLLAD